MCFICHDPKYLYKTNCCSQYVHDICMCRWLDTKIREGKYMIRCPYCNNCVIKEFWDFVQY